MVASSIPTALRERASVHPNGAAITYIDYEQDWAGVAETLTWSQLYRRMLNVAEPLRHVGATGDRAVILAPQGIEYVVGFRRVAGRTYRGSAAGSTCRRPR